MDNLLGLVAVGACVLAAYVALRLVHLTGARAAWTFVALAWFVIALARVLDIASSSFERLRGVNDARIERVLDVVAALLVCVGSWFMQKHFLRARRHEALQRELFRGSNDAEFLIDARGLIVDANERATELLGYEVAELRGMSIEDLAAPEQIDQVGPRLSEVLDRGDARFERTQLTKDRRRVPVEIRARRITLDGVTLVHALSRDLTLHKLAEESLRESNARYQSLFEHTALGVYRTTPEGRIVLANPALVRLLGCRSQEELAGLDLEANARDTSYDRRRFLEVIERDGVVAGMETTWKRRDGSVAHARENARAVRDASGKTIAYEGTIEDITERRHLEAQLIQSQKMEAVGRLAGGVAHDFNNLLTAIIGYAEILLVKLTPDDPRRREAEQVIRAGERAAALTRQLLAFSRKEIFQPRPIDLNLVTSDFAPMLRRLIGEDVQVETNFGADSATILGDPGQIEQVLMNLVVNARDAMPRGGRLTISTSTAMLAVQRLSCGDDVQPGLYAALTVTDTGAGMGPETMSHLFEPFFTTKQPGKGTGLGLAMVYGITHQHRGHIDVTSAPGRGTTFIVYLPVADELVASSGTHAQPAEPKAARGNETILVAEDDPSVLALTNLILTGLGYRVLAANSGRAALVLAKEHAGEIDLLLSDLVMPEMDGGELAEALREIRPRTPVLFMSGHTDDSVLRGRIGSGDVRFLAKPFTARDIAVAVRAAIDSGQQATR